MVLSLIFVAVLGVFSQAPPVQVPLAIILSFVQIFLPAILKPLVEPAENDAALSGGAVYFFVELAVMAKLVSELANGDDLAALGCAHGNNSLQGCGVTGGHLKRRKSSPGQTCHAYVSIAPRLP